MTTDNEYFIAGSHKDHNIITYEKGLASPEKMTTANITKTVLKGFGTGVGGFSNTATILYAMAAIFDKPGHEDQYAEIMTRIKLLREIVGQEIDRIKGADKPSLPREWRKFETFSPSDTPEEIASKKRANAMVVSKKPYFFRYLYPELNRKYKQFEASYNQVSRDTFGIKFKKLLKKEDKTPEEKDLVRRYQKYSPLITAPCTMNKLCREIESIDFDIKFNKDDSGAKKSAVSLLPTFESIYAPTFSDVKFAAVKKMYQKYTSRKSLKNTMALLTSYTVDDDPSVAKIRSEIYDALIVDIQNDLVSADISNEEFLFYCHRVSSTYSQFNWGFAWDILGDSIVSLIPSGHSSIPVRVDPLTPSSHEYLGEYYVLKGITNKYDISIQKLFNSIFGEPDLPSAPEIESLISDVIRQEKEAQQS